MTIFQQNFLMLKNGLETVEHKQLEMVSQTVFGQKIEEHLIVTKSQIHQEGLIKL